MLQMLPFNTFIFSFQTCSLNSKYASRMVAGMTINYSWKKHNMFIRTKKLFLYRCKVRGRSFACCFGAKADKWITCERRGKGFDYIISLLDGLKTPILLRRSSNWSKATFICTLTANISDEFMEGSFFSKRTDVDLLRWRIIAQIEQISKYQWM